jgi:hypothetical protein
MPAETLSEWQTIYIQNKYGNSLLTIVPSATKKLSSKLQTPGQVIKQCLDVHGDYGRHSCICSFV